MKKRILLSAVLAGVLVLSGCGGNSSNPSVVTDPTPGSDSTTVNIVADDGAVANIDPTVGGTFVIRKTTNTNTDANTSTTTNIVATVVRAELNKCNGVDTLGSRVACGPKPGVTYVFQSDFGALGPVDNNASTPDGGALLFDALTEYNGIKYNTPLEGNQDENRIQEVYIPSNYIVLDDMAKSDTNAQKYEYMKEYLANSVNIKHYMAENKNNPYFDDNNASTTIRAGIESGSFLATYVMHFTRGTGEVALLEKFKTVAGKTENLEYLTVSFRLDVNRIDNNSSKLRFTSPAGSDVVFGAKKAGQSTSIIISTTNIDMNSMINITPGNLDNYIPINIAKYFNKVIEKGEAIGVANFAKDILVENALNPWPVKIYGTLHEINDDNVTFQRSFIRNPAELNASLFGLDKGISPYAAAYAPDGNNTNQAYKFNIVYPGGVYNKLP